MEITVLLAGNWSEDSTESLRQRLDPSIRLITDPSQGQYSVIISGRPDEDLLLSPSVTHLLIPFAGLPGSTAELMMRHGQVSVHNIHHNAAAASELAIGLMLAAARLMIPADSRLRKGDWSCRYRQERAVLVQGSRVLVLGLGAIGSRIARICRSMGAEVRGIRRDPVKAVEIFDIGVHLPEDLHDMLPDTDILFLALPLTKQTEHIIGDRELSLLHSRSILVNIGRGALVEPGALYRHLMEGSIGSAGIDVWYNYPSSREAESCDPAPFDFSSLDNVVMTPHLGGAFGSPDLEDIRMDHLARSINTLAHDGVMPHRIDLKMGY